MIFVGDIALPHKGAIKYSEFPKEFYSKNWFGNLEGAIVNHDDNKLNAIYNQKDAIEELISNFHFKGFALANNHIFDIGSYEETINFLSNKNISYCGIGTNLNEANKELVFEENGVQIVIVNFGWEVIQCEITTGNKVGVNPLRKQHVIDTVCKLIEKYPNGKIIPYMHWGYELESEPQPFERELAKKLIDLGAAGVIGCHSHRIGGFEIYKDKPIVYSLGNWMFKQNHFFGEKHKFPDFCNLQLALEWNFEDDLFQFHFFEFIPTASELIYRKTEGLISDTMNQHTPFKNLTAKEYQNWYKKNHFHKRKGLPIYYWNDSFINLIIKNKWIKVRDRLLKFFFNKGK